MRQLYMIGNAHIDPVWLWQWQEGLAEVRATFASALDRLEAHPDLVFTCDSVAYLEWVERVDPELFARIARRVEEGRWDNVGGWWIEPDCNVPAGESYVRQALYGQRFLQDRFGRIATVGCNVDPFGHNAQLPQLLSKAGLRAYLFLRPEPREKELPGEVFWWASPDGSRVLAYRIPYGYTSPGDAIDEFLEKVLERAPKDGEDLMVFYGVGNHGGGPTEENLASIARLDAEDNGLALELSGPEAFLERAATRDLPTYVGDLQHHAVGCYSAHSGVKAWNRRAEHQLMAAERWASVASVVAGQRYPSERLAEAWKLVLFNQFHDTLAGTAIEPAYVDARDQYGHASSIATDVWNQAVQSVSRRIAVPAEEGTIPIVVANPHAFATSVDVEFEFEGTSSAEVVATAEDGGPVAIQRIRSLATLGGRHRRLVLAAELPPLGYRTYRLRPVALADQVGTEEAAEATYGSSLAPAGTPAAHVLENDHLRVVVDPETGWLSSLVDKATGAELALGTPHGHAVVLEDPSDTWSHDVRSYEDEAGRFACSAVRRVEDGPVRSTLVVESTFGASRLTERLVLGRRARHLEVRVTLDWRERLRALKLRFPSALADATATFSIPYGQLERPADGSEEPAQSWVDVSGALPDGRRAGWSLLNDSKHGFDVSGSEIGMTSARSPVYAWHDPQPLDPALREEYHYLDQGIQEFTYALVPHDGDWRSAGTVRLAEQLNQVPLVVLEHFHPGELPPARAFCSSGDRSVVVSVVKVAEDGSGLVLRLVETSGERAAATIELALLGRSFEVELAPSEVKTFLVPLQPGELVREVSLLEWDDPSGPDAR